METNIKALHIPADESQPTKVVDLPIEPFAQLEAMQTLVGGSTELAVTTYSLDLYVNEGGLILDLPENLRANSLIDAIATAETKKLVRGTVVVGDVLITGTGNRTGELTSLDLSALPYVPK